MTDGHAPEAAFRADAGLTSSQQLEELEADIEAFFDEADQLMITHKKYPEAVSETTDLDSTKNCYVRIL